MTEVRVAARKGGDTSLQILSQASSTAGRAGRARPAARVDLQPLRISRSQRAAATQRGLRARRPPRRGDRDAAGLEESTPLVYLERLRLTGPEPLALDKVWLPEQIAAPLLDVDFTHTALYTQYARLRGVAMTGARNASGRSWRPPRNSGCVSRATDQARPPSNSPPQASMSATGQAV